MAGAKSWQPEILFGSGLNGGWGFGCKNHLAKSYIVDLNLQTVQRG